MLCNVWEGNGQAPLQRRAIGEKRKELNGVAEITTRAIVYRNEVALNGVQLYRDALKKCK